MNGTATDDDDDGAGCTADEVLAVRVPYSEWDKMLGLNVSDHPLFGLEHTPGHASDVSVAAAQAEGSGLVGEPEGHPGRSPVGQRRAWDLEGSIEVRFPATYAQVALHIAEDAIVATKGRADAREDTVRHRSGARGPDAGVRIRTFAALRVPPADAWPTAPPPAE